MMWVTVKWWLLYGVWMASHLSSSSILCWQSLRGWWGEVKVHKTIGVLFGGGGEWEWSGEKERGWDGVDYPQHIFIRNPWIIYNIQYIAIYSFIFLGENTRGTTLLYMAYVWHFLKSSQIKLVRVLFCLYAINKVLIAAPQWAMIDCCKHLLLFNSRISISRQQQLFPLLVKCHQQCFLFNCHALVKTWTNNGTDRCIVHLSNHTQYTQIVIFFCYNSKHTHYPPFVWYWLWWIMIACLLVFEVISIKFDVLMKLFFNVNGPFTNCKNKQKMI